MLLLLWILSSRHVGVGYVFFCPPESTKTELINHQKTHNPERRKNRCIPDPFVLHWGCSFPSQRPGSLINQKNSLYSTQNTKRCGTLNSSSSKLNFLFFFLTISSTDSGTCLGWLLNKYVLIWKAVSLYCMYCIYCRWHCFVRAQ